MAEQVWTVRSMLAWAKPWLERKGVDTPRLDAELLLARALGCDRVRLYVDHDKPLSADELAKVKAMLLRRAEREPVAYILGAKEFYGRPFEVKRGVFIPRPDTELLVQLALEALDACQPAAGEPLRALDLCAGSGAVGVTLAAERASLEVELVELSPDAAPVARANATTHAPGRAHVLEGDLYAPLAPGRRYHAITANPPYVPHAQRPDLAPEITLHEPPLAVFADDDGLAVVRRIVEGARERLQPGGFLGFELDPPQAAAAMQLCERANLTGVRAYKDLAGDDRVVVARAPA